MKEIRLSTKPDGVYSTEGSGPWFGPGIGYEYVVAQTTDALKLIDRMAPEERAVLFAKIRPVYQRLVELLNEEG